MEPLLNRIHKCNDYERELFGARRTSFRENMSRWHSDICPEQPNQNFFEAAGDVSAEDIQAAVDLQKSRGLHYWMLRTTAPLDPALVESFGLETERTLVMALGQDTSHGWKENSALEIRDIQTSDISRDILDVSDVPEKFRAQALQSMQLILSIARDHPEYHWLCGYWEGRKVANVYALCHSGCVEMDDLWVDADFRHRRIATTLMGYIAKNLRGTLYLHANADKTPREMYARMGFETVERIYEYFMEW